MSKFQVGMNIAIFIGTIITFIYFTNKSKLKANGTLEVERKRKLHNRYVFYNNNVFLRRRFRRIVMQYSSLACYDMDTIIESSVKLFEKAVGVSLLMPLISIVALRDVMLTMLVAFVGYIYYDITVDKAIDKVYVQIIEETSNCIQSIRERYMETDSIPKAVLYSDKGVLLDKPINRIYDMLASTDSEERLYEFCRTTPVRIIKTLAMVCHIVNENGDERKENGSSAFSDEMTSLRQEADTEIRRLTKTRIAFKSLSGLALVGLVGTPIIDLFLVSQIPGTAVLVKGLYGMFEKTLIIGVTILAYYVISVLNRPSVVNQTDKVEWIDNLSKQKKVKEKLQNIIPKKFKIRMKLQKMIDGSISSKTFEYIYLSKVIYSVLLAIGTTIFIVCFVIAAKAALWNNYKSLSFIPDSKDITEKMYNQIKICDKLYMTTFPKMTDEEATKLVKSRVMELSTTEVTNQVTRLSTKYDKYYGMGFKWYYVLFVLASGCVGWFVPEVSLKLRQKLVKFEETEDVMQLQTMMIVLSNTKMDVQKALYWLERQSTIHKAPLRYAYHDYASDPEACLDRLRATVGSIDFKRLISKLHSAIYNLSLSDAFSDMALDKEQSLRVREMLQDETLASKKEWARLIASAPISIMLIGGFVGPIIVLGFSEILKMFGSLNI
ncbi:MAG: hypothetical protein HFI05_01925 [Lachnospiraceae bacterium]|nr:hypothetical protein [Lachnospiraceae bacterium]